MIFRLGDDVDPFEIRGLSRSTLSNDLVEFTLQRFIGCIVIIVAPENEFEHLRVDFSKAAQSRAQTTACFPILFLRRGDIFIG
jgi:hypothetical protein